MRRRRCGRQQPGRARRRDCSARGVPRRWEPGSGRQRASSSPPPPAGCTPGHPGRRSPSTPSRRRSRRTAGPSCGRRRSRPSSPYATSTALLVGRLANLYGPGQDLDKPQGLVSQLCRAQLTRQPLTVYVPLDTMRDYLFVDDAAAMAVAGLGAVTPSGRRALKVLASERSTTVGAVLGDLHRVTRRRPPVVLGVSPRSRRQVRDLRLRSVAWPHGHAARDVARHRRYLVSGDRGHASPVAAGGPHEAPGHRRRRVHRQPLRAQSCSPAHGAAPDPTASWCSTS